MRVGTEKNQKVYRVNRFGIRLGLDRVEIIEGKPSINFSGKNSPASFVEVGEPRRDENISFPKVKRRRFTKLSKDTEAYSPTRQVPEKTHPYPVAFLLSVDFVMLQVKQIDLSHNTACHKNNLILYGCSVMVSGTSWKNGWESISISEIDDR